MYMYTLTRFGSRELIGGVAVQLEHADLFGLTVHSRIEQQSSGLEVREYTYFQFITCSSNVL